MMRTSPLSFWALCVVFAVLIPGCGGGSKGPELGQVSGTVMMNGMPVPGVHVTFAPKSKGSPSYGTTNENGEYSLMFNQSSAGAIVGMHDVLIEPQEPKTDDSGKPLSPTPPVKIPRKYQQTGALYAEVNPGHNDLDFTINPALKP